MYERANQGIVVTDIDANGENEMICLTSGVNSLAGELLTPGSFFIASGVGDVSSYHIPTLTFFKLRWRVEASCCWRRRWRREFKHISCWPL